MYRVILFDVVIDFLKNKILIGFLLFLIFSMAHAYDISNGIKGKPIFIQIFKTESILELYEEDGDTYKLVRAFPICKFSGGLGPKKQQGDFKSPEGFYTATYSQLKPDSQYHRAINLGFPNAYDKSQGYTGNYLMIHGDCVSVGCYAMQDAPMEEIYNYAEAALLAGQTHIPIHIYPFKMTKENLNKYKFSENYTFWQQLAKGYEYFQKHSYPAMVTVESGQYAISQMLPSDLRLAANQSINSLFVSAPNSLEVMVNSLETSERSDSLPNKEQEDALLNSIKLAKDNH
ncbi:L,D-transpeptidase family protein [Thorsellia anophelis]|uniref:Murein L,D-transpeptidase YafK n=1 Tax=Thorsellia anophelis DSM 18579 TaxID=1123402 RepID=A0A1I0BYE6_9GAMM|nr:murein L,D-transpeptidase family protein [Thorsellia anophelis]SET12028.1 Murein L,D-transpeptidase YafK [Thorsellia anophelis DSM 18579]